jgi:predicted dehydrogenase
MSHAAANLAPVRLGLIGAGGIVTSRHLPGLSILPGVTFHSVCNRTLDSGQRVAQQWNIAQVADDWRRILDDPQVDAVLVGTWPYMHRAMSVAALEAGKHVFCQARLAANLADAQAMAAAAAAHPRLVNLVCPPPHRMPYEPFIRKLLADGALGQLQHAHLDVRNGSALGALSWREQTQFSGIHIMQVGIWAETLHAWLGPVRTLTAALDSPITSKAGQSVDIPQIVTLHNTLATGLPVTELHSGVARGDNTNLLTLYGSAATLRIPIEGGHHGALQWSSAGQTYEALEVPAALRNPWRVEAEFIHAVRTAMAGGAWEKAQLPAAPDAVAVRTSPTFAQALPYMHKMHAIHHSARTGSAVAVEG